MTVTGNTLRLMPVLSFALFIAYFSIVPSAAMPDLNLWDKLQHFGAYLVFVLLTYPLTLAVIAICAYGGLLEIAQAYSPGRYASILDFLANSLGAIFGLLLLRLCPPIKQLG